MATRIKQRPKLQYTDGDWRKRYKGEVHYLTTRYEVPNTPDDMDRLYLNVWLPMKARIDAGQEVSRKPMQSVMTAWGQGPDVEPASEPQSVATRAVDVPNGVGMASSLAGLPDELPETANGKVDTSLAHVLEEFLGEYRTAVEAGRKSAATWREYKDKLADFQSFAEHYKRSDVNEIDEHLLRHYQAHTASLLKADGTGGERISVGNASK